jgi:SAM-dependent methyltransferase
MDDCSSRRAASANETIYNSGWTEIFVDGAPHLKHASLRALFHRLLERALRRAFESTSLPRVLDIGAGEGSVTRQLLERGAQVTAVDISSSQLAELGRKCHEFGSRLELECGDIAEFLGRSNEKFDVVVASACLHHLPDYLGVIRGAVKALEPNGQFVSFQDPMSYNSVGRFGRALSELGYLSWRIFQGDLWGGFRRRLRRSRGVFDDSPLDNAEYHVLRNGVDQDAIKTLLEESGFNCEIIRYFSTQSSVFQPIGVRLGVTNSFAIVATRGPGHI